MKKAIFLTSFFFTLFFFAGNCFADICATSTSYCVSVSEAGVDLEWDPLLQSDINTVRGDCILETATYTVEIIGEGSVDTGVSTSYTYSGLSPDTYYDWRVTSNYQCDDHNNTGSFYEDYNFTTLNCNQSPYIEPSSQELDYLPVYCTGVQKQGQVGLIWIYKDDDGDDESQYDLRINDTNDFNNLEVDRTVAVSFPSGSQNTAVVTINPVLDGDNITYNKSYYWWVRVWDDEGGDSGWVQYDDALDPDGDGNSLTFTTAPHACPWPDFLFFPPAPIVGEVVTFVETPAQCYDNNNNPVLCSSFRWDFDASDGVDLDLAPDKISTPGEIVTTTYSSFASFYTVTMRTIDTESQYCETTKDINMELPLPEWKETPPVSWLKKAMSALINFFYFNI